MVQLASYWLTYDLSLRQPIDLPPFLSPIAMPFAKSHPLLVPEIILLLSRLVSLKDALSCVRVCHAWNDAFASVIWHTVDFNVQERFINMDSATVKKHGHRIRVVNGVQSNDHLLALHHSSLCKLKSLTIVMLRDSRFQAYCGDLLRQNATSITNLDVSARIRSRHTPICFPFDAIYLPTGSQATSRLSFLKIQNLPLTRDGFSWLLRLCPALKTLHVEDMTIYDESCSEPYQHTGLTELIAPIEQVFRPDIDYSANTLILAHFPRLESFYTWSPKTLLTISLDQMKGQFEQNCPLLRHIGIDAPTNVTTALLTQVFESLTAITISAEDISVNVIMAITSHLKTLESISTSGFNEGYDQDEVPQLSGDPSASVHDIQLIPQTCSRLTKIEFPTRVMEMSDIEETDWSCTQLEELYIRIRNLETKDKIDRAIQLWIELGKVGMKNAEEKEHPVTGTDLYRESCLQDEVANAPHNGDSIEERVAQHLVRFERLRKVWLGHKVKCIRV
jgi:hypothetical protein